MGARNLGWAIAALYFIQSCLTTLLPRTDKTLPLRADYRNWHILIGVTLLILLILRLRAWWQTERGAAANVGLRPGLSNRPHPPNSPPMPRASLLCPKASCAV